MGAADTSSHGPLEGDTTLWDGMEGVQGSLRPQMERWSAEMANLAMCPCSGPAVPLSSLQAMLVHELVCVCVCVCRGGGGAGPGNLPPQDLAHQTCVERRDIGHPHTHAPFQRRPLLEMGGPRYEEGSCLGPQARTQNLRRLSWAPSGMQSIPEVHRPDKARWSHCPACESQVCEGVGVTMFLSWATHSPLVMQTRALSPASSEAHKTQGRGA